ncbi:serine protein kinase RIO [Candidatus Bathyarchaeota archaeon]|nr:serine protein kinase RIO [Candidatus Bathyarchaeota archaeon]
MTKNNNYLDERKRKRLDHKLQIVEKRDRLLNKDRTSDRAVFEEVFDKSTLMTLYSLLNHGIVDKIFGVLKSGKESRIYRGVDSEGTVIALKIYLTVAIEFKKMLPYIQGDPRFKRTKRSKRSLVYAWAQKEFKNLQRAYVAGIYVPKPIHVKKNVLIMEFIGEGNIPVPTLKDKPPKNITTARRMYKEIIRNVKTLYHKAGLIHGDLSEYNIMNKEGVPIIFDMSQAVLVDHPKAEKFLLRDINNLNRFFKRTGVQVKETKKLYKWVTKGE